MKKPLIAVALLIAFALLWKWERVPVKAPETVQAISSAPSVETEKAPVAASETTPRRDVARALPKDSVVKHDAAPDAEVNADRAQVHDRDEQEAETRALQNPGILPEHPDSR